MRLLSDAQAIARLNKVLDAQPDKKAWAEAKGLNYTYALDVAAGRRPMGESVAKAIGLVRGWKETG